MKRATGKTDPVVPIATVSIRSSDGHAFSCDPLPEGEAPRALILSPHTLFVPHALFREERCADLLRANGWPMEADRVAVHTAPDREPVAVVAVPASMQLVLDACTAITVPLIEAQAATPTLFIHRQAGLGYYKVWSDGMQCYEVLPTATVDDMLYVVAWIASLYPLRHYAVCVSGEEAAAGARALHRHCKNVRCAS